jgi:hypothetical protein
MSRIGAIQLVRECSEQTVAVANGVGGIETQLAELMGELLSILRGIAEDKLDYSFVLIISYRCELNV